MKKLLDINKFSTAVLAVVCAFVLSCKPEPLPEKGGDGSGEEIGGGEETEIPENPPVSYNSADGVKYVFDKENIPSKLIPEIHIDVSLEQWNALLGYYDKDADTKEYIHCDVKYCKGPETSLFTDAAMRLRGNTSRRRPEGVSGQMHAGDKADWHHFHIGLNLRKYVKDDEHELHGQRKLNLKWFKDDACYAREVFCYDLFERFGCWQSPKSTYCRLWIKVEGDSKETYLGVYEMVEPIDENFLKARKSDYNIATKGNLWKCRYGASLASTSASFGADDNVHEYVYELKTNTDEFSQAEEQLKDFILKLTGKTGDSFKTWISTVCDVELLLKTYAVNVVCGMWDDYWCNTNNYYIYFDSKDKLDYKFYFIPYDYDNTLGTSGMMDSGRQDPFNWGGSDKPLISKILQYPEYKKIYSDALKALVASGSGYADRSYAMSRIKVWQSAISPYVSNDTGEDMVIEDKPASWGNHSEYRIYGSSNNWFDVKAESIQTYCK